MPPKKITELVPTGITIIGVRVPAIRKIAQAWHQANKDTTPDTALDLLDAAFKRRCREELLFATVIVSRLKKKLTAAHLMRIDPLIEHIEDWEVCDQLSMNVIGEIVAADLGETARLGAVSVHHKRCSFQSLLHEPWNNHTVAPGLPWPNDVEEAYHDDLKSFFFEIGATKELI